MQRTTFAALKDQVARCAGALRKCGVGYGDRVIIYMPMVPETLIAMLACARLGAIHSVVFGGFAAHELATRIDDAKPKLIVSASCGVVYRVSRRLLGRSRCSVMRAMISSALSTSVHEAASSMSQGKPLSATTMDKASSALTTLPP